MVAGEAQCGIGDRDGVAYMSFTLASVALALELDAEDEAALLLGASQETFAQIGGSPDAYETARQAALALDVGSRVTA